MTSDELSAGAGVLLSVVFAYVPGVRAWFGGLDSDWKRVVMLVSLLAAALLVVGLSCAGIAGTVPCTQAGALALARAFAAALITNQATYLISPRPAA